jgi:hypothetical protein
VCAYGVHTGTVLWCSIQFNSFIAKVLQHLGIATKTLNTNIHM